MQELFRDDARNGTDLGWTRVVGHLGPRFCLRPWQMDGKQPGAAARDTTSDDGDEMAASEGGWRACVIVVRAFFSDLGSSGKRIRNSERLFITRWLRWRRSGGGRTRGHGGEAGAGGTSQQTTEGAAHARRQARLLARHILRRHVDTPTTHLLLRLLLRCRRDRPPDPDIRLYAPAVRRANLHFVVGNLRI